MRSNIDASDRLVMSLELILKSKVASRPSVELDVDIPRNRKCLPVGGEGVVGDGVVEEVMNFRAGHCEFMGVCDRRSSLLPLYRYRFQVRG
jgi:hypothetical protein